MSCLTRSNRLATAMQQMLQLLTTRRFWQSASLKSSELEFPFKLPGSSNQKIIAGSTPLARFFYLFIAWKGTSRTGNSGTDRPFSESAGPPIYYLALCARMACLGRGVCQTTQWPAAVRIRAVCPRFPPVFLMPVHGNQVPSPRCQRITPIPSTQMVKAPPPSTKDMKNGRYGNARMPFRTARPASHRGQ